MSDLQAIAQVMERMKALEETLQIIITPGFFNSQRVIRDKVINDAWALLENENLAKILERK